MAKRRVYKYPIPMNSMEFTVLLPRGYKVNRVGWQQHELFMWATVDVEAPQDKVKFRLFGTGQEIPDSMEFVATWDLGPLVMHCYRE